MRFLVNPGAKGHRKPARRAASKAPTKRQLAARKKFTAMAKARAAAARTTTRAAEGTTMKRKRKAAHRRKSVRRVGTARRRVAVYAANPKRRRRRAAGARRTTARRRTYRRNPSFGSAKSAAMQIGMGLGGALGGMALGNLITQHVAPKVFAPSATDTPQSIALRNAGIVGLGAIGVMLLGRKFAPAPVVYSVALGMMIVPAKNLITAYAPQAGTFLGGAPMAMPAFRRPNGSIAAYPQGRKQIGAYPRANGRGGVAAYPQMGAYPAAAYSQVQPS